MIEQVKHAVAVEMSSEHTGRRQPNVADDPDTKPGVLQRAQRQFDVGREVRQVVAVLGTDRSSDGIDSGLIKLYTQMVHQNRGGVDIRELPILGPVLVEGHQHLAKSVLNLIDRTRFVAGEIGEQVGEQSHATLPCTRDIGRSAERVPEVEGDGIESVGHNQSLAHQERTGFTWLAGAAPTGQNRDSQRRVVGEPAGTDARDEVIDGDGVTESGHAAGTSPDNPRASHTD